MGRYQLLLGYHSVANPMEVEARMGSLAQLSCNKTFFWLQSIPSPIAMATHCSLHCNRMDKVRSCWVPAEVLVAVAVVVGVVQVAVLWDIQLRSSYSTTLSCQMTRVLDSCNRTALKLSSEPLFGWGLELVLSLGRHSSAEASRAIMEPRGATATME